jgi:hypothetical protein
VKLNARDMTAIQELIRFINNDRMQEVYTKEQMIELLEFKLEKEKQQLIDAWKLGNFAYSSGEQMYNEQYTTLKK